MSTENDGLWPHWADADTAKGFKLIRDMTKAELIEEILAEQREFLLKAELDQLRLRVVQFRLHDVQQRLLAESGIDGVDFTWNSNGLL